MKEVGVFFSGLVQELAGLREAAVLGLSSLQAEHDKLEDEIRRAQERHQTVRERPVLTRENGAGPGSDPTSSTLTGLTD